MLIIGLSGVTLSIVSFGLSRSFTGLVVSRCMGGALNGNVACVLPPRLSCPTLTPETLAASSNPS